MGAQAGASELLGEFERAARAAAATVERVPPSAEAIAAAVRKTAPKAQRIAVAEPLDLPSPLFDACRRLPGVFSGRSRQELAAADLGITDAFAGVASSGSVCVWVDQGFAGYISLLPRGHIVVLEAASLVPRPGDLFRAGCLAGKGLGRDFVFITGPSATADMGPLVRGVHGPHWLHILVVG